MTEGGGFHGARIRKVEAFGKLASENSEGANSANKGKSAPYCIKHGEMPFFDITANNGEGYTRKNERGKERPKRRKAAVYGGLLIRDEIFKAHKPS